MSAKSVQSCSTLCDPMDCSHPGSSVRGTLQARILGWFAMPSSRGLPDPGIEPSSPAAPASGRFFPAEPVGAELHKLNPTVCSSLCLSLLPSSNLCSHKCNVHISLLSKNMRCVEWIHINNILANNTAKSSTDHLPRKLNYFKCLCQNKWTKAFLM